MTKLLCRSTSCRLIAHALAAFFVLLATLAHAQDSQFLFDPNGNLLVQTGATNAPPQITGQPQNQVVGPGETAAFSVVATGTLPLTFQWRVNIANIGGATGDALLLENVSANDQDEYRVVVTNPSGSVTSAPAFLFLDSDHDGLGDPLELFFFGNLNQNATGDRDGDGSSNLEEFRNRTHPADANSCAFRLLVINDAGTVIKTPDRTTYTNGQTVTLTAIPPPNGAFHAWLGDIVTRSNPVTLVMTRDMTVYARFTPIEFNWTNVTSGDWNVAANWKPNLVPGSNDTVMITNNLTVTLDTPADCFDVTLGSGPWTNPTLTGTGQLKVRGHFIWASGVMSGNGRTVLEPGARLTLDNPSLVFLSARTLELGGETFWTGPGIVALNLGAVITNRAGALFHVQNAAGLGGGGANGRLDNAGTFRKSVNTGTTTFASGMSLNNSGTVEIQTGTLNLGGGGTHSGSFDVSADTALILSGGFHAAGGSSSITGAGQFTVSGGAATLAGLVNVSGSNIFSGGTATFTGNHICTNNTVTISGSATANFSGSGLVSPAVLDLINATLSGTSTVTVNNVMNWTGGSMNGSGRTIIPAGVTLNAAIQSGATLLDTRTLENGGTILWTGAGNFGLFGGAVITNRAGALFHAQNAASLGFFAAVRFDNAGTFRKSANNGTLTIGSFGTFNNFGTVEIEAGTVLCTGGFNNSGSVSLSAGTTHRLAGGGSASGSFSAPAAALVEWTGGGFTLNPGAQLNGAGLYKINGGNVTANANLTVQNLDLVHGSSTLDGTGAVTIANAMNWTTGTMRGSGRTTISAGATLQVGSANGVTVNRTLENGGTAIWTGAGTVIVLNGVITNRAGALFHAQNAATFFPIGGARFDNAGTFRKSVSTGTTTVPSGMSFNNSGIVDIRNGILAANGGYVSSANALLNCVLSGISPGTGYGQLQVGGSVVLAGNLSVALTNNFIPPVNSLYTVLSAGSRSGSFANFFYPTNDADMVMSNTPSSVVVRALGPHFATTALPDAMRNLGYTQQVVAVMNSGPIAYSMIVGALPAGLSFSSGGTISGIPTVFGDSLFTIQASDAGGVTIQHAFNLRVRNLPPEGLISWWRAENNALDSISTNHGVLTNGATFAAGNVGQTFALDGVNDYVHVSDAPNLRPSSITLEAWAMFNSQNGPVFTKPLGPATGDSFALYLLGGTLNGFVHDTNASGVLVSSPSTLATGQWHHVAFSFDDSTKEQALYVNGVRVATSQSNRSIGYDNKPVLLGQDINNGIFDFPLNGRIDEASIYNRALSSNEIAAIHLAGSAGKPLNAPYFVTSARLPDAVLSVGYTQQVSAVLGTSPITFSTPSGGLPSGLNFSFNGTISGIPFVAGTHSFLLRATDSLGAFTDQQTTLRVLQPVAAPSGLISWWRGEGNALDSAGANHGTASNGVVYVAGKVGQGFAFDGINDHVFIPDATNLRPTSITLEAWAKFNGTQGPVLGRSFGAGIHNSYVIWQSSGVLNGTIEDVNLVADILSTPFAPVAGQWYHVAFTFDDATKQQALYLNGTLVASGQSFRSIGYDTHPVLLGGDIDNGSVSFLLNGGVDEAAIYNRALTVSEIAAIHDAGIAGKQLLTPIARPMLFPPEISSSNVLLSWTAVSNQTYRLEFNPDLGPTNWIALPGDVTTLSNRASKLDALTSSNRFYRVRVLP